MGRVTPGFLVGLTLEMLSCLDLPRTTSVGALVDTERQLSTEGSHHYSSFLSATGQLTEQIYLVPILFDHINPSAVPKTTRISGLRYLWGSSCMVASYRSKQCNGQMSITTNTTNTTSPHYWAPQDHHQIPRPRPPQYSVSNNEQEQEPQNPWALEISRSTSPNQQC